jgi:hypothetical protein
MVSFKGAHFVQDSILMCVRWYVVYPLRDRQVEELMQERGVSGKLSPSLPLRAQQHCGTGSRRRRGNDRCGRAVA